MGSSESSFTLNLAPGRHRVNGIMVSSPEYSFSQFQPPASQSGPSFGEKQVAPLAEAPTPSLCSDNGLEREDESTDRLPSTPPIVPSRAVFRFKGTGVPVESQVQSAVNEVIDVDMEDEHTALAQEQKATSDAALIKSSKFLHADNPFDRRPPSSPMPEKSPRKPRPPARLLRSHPVSPVADKSDDEDPLSMSFPPLESFLQPTISKHHLMSEQLKSQLQRSSRIPQKVPMKSRSVSRVSSSREAIKAQRKGREKSASQSRRPQSLQEELGKAAAELRHELAWEDDLDSGVFMGVGTMSKRRGFLAHGGAGGAPVFMGVGYVEGAEEDKDDDAAYETEEADEEYLPRSKERGKRRIAHARTRTL